MKNKHHSFLLKIVVPTILAIILFIISMIFIILPAFEENLIASKREMIKELTNSTYSIFEKYASDITKDSISLQEAQRKVIAEIEILRYGAENKDCFWICDTSPKMIMHPYRTDLNGADLTNYTDPTGKKLFLEVVRVVKESSKGYVDYMWQWKDNPNEIVPKLSYVREFKEWGWILGTGIYIEDVKEEISLMESRIINISIVILLIISMLLIFMTVQSLKIENRRVYAENSLMESREKYRLIVEASKEGSLMVINGKIIYSNLAIQKQLEYSAAEFGRLNLIEIFQDNEFGKLFFNEVKNNKSLQIRIDAKLLTKNGNIFKATLYTSEIEFGVQKGVTIIIKDLSKNIVIENELSINKERLSNLINNLDLGVLRTTFENRSRFIEANPAALKILGFISQEQLMDKVIFDIFFDSIEKKNFLRRLIKDKKIKNIPIRISREDGETHIVSISATVVQDLKSDMQFCDVIIEDITAIKNAEEKRENLISDLQTSQFFMNQAIKYLTHKVIKCSINDSIKEVAEKMVNEQSGAILVYSESICIGIVTDYDLRQRVVSKALDLKRSVSEIMTAPLINIQDTALVFEATLLMHEEKIEYLGVKDSNDKTIGIISQNDLRQLQIQSSSYITKDIENAKTFIEIQKSHNKLSTLIQTMVENGAKVKNIASVMSSVFDLVTQRLIEFAITELGTPPVKFAFILLGSEGRGEQTLATDQDNALIYEDVPVDKEEEVKQYFQDLSNFVCNHLDTIGYNFCNGGVMAKNSKWCQPISQWKNYFTTWINSSEPQDLLEVNIFFDYRSIYGEKLFTTELTKHINDLTNNRPQFFIFLAKNSLLNKLPLNMFGKIVLESSDEDEERFNIKEAINPLVGFARVYSLKNNISEANTLNRLEIMYNRKIIEYSTYTEMQQTYKHLMNLRLKHQVSQINKNESPDNLIDLEQLTTIEKTLLKKVFSQISNFQSKLNYDFLGGRG